MSLLKEEEAQEPPRYPILRVVTSVIWVLVTVFVYLFAGNISRVIPLAGVAVLHFQFTLPGAFEFAQTKTFMPASNGEHNFSLCVDHGPRAPFGLA